MQLTSRIGSTIHFDSRGGVHPSWHAAVAVQRRARHLLAYSEVQSDMSSQRGLLPGVGIMVRCSSHSSAVVYLLTHSARRGVIGPSRQLGRGSMYYPEVYALLFGAFLPIPLWIWQRRYPTSWIRYINTPLVLTSISSIPPATGINYSSWFLMGFIFQYVIRRRSFAWWSKFNYVTSAALDSGMSYHLISTCDN